MPVHPLKIVVTLVLVVALLGGAAPAVRADLMIIGMDEKVTFDAEGNRASPDGKYLYVGNYIDRDVSILKVDGTRITNTGKKLTLPGQPASMRGRHP